MTSATGSSRGLTLIEVLVSVVILAVGAVAIAQALAKASEAQAIADDYAAANLLALSKMADVELAFRKGEPVEDGQTGSVRLGLRSFDWQVAAAPLMDDPNTSTVTLVVNWRRGRTPYERRVDTLLRLPLVEAP